jgi:hypothetical protein
MTRFDGALKGTFQNIELAIVYAIHKLAPASEYSDGSCRCKDIFALVKNAVIEVEGQLQQGGHRFSIFSSALCGRRSASRLFQRVTTQNRRGSWWALKVPFDEAVHIATSLHGRQPSGGDDGECEIVLKVSREELIRGRFESLVPLAMMKAELIDQNEALADRQRELEVQLAALKEDVPYRAVTDLNELRRLRRRSGLADQQEQIFARPG